MKTILIGIAIASIATFATVKTVKSKSSNPCARKTLTAAERDKYKCPADAPPTKK